MPSMDIQQLYPEGVEEPGERIRASVHFSLEDHQDIQFFADLWTAFDEAQRKAFEESQEHLPKKKRKKWKKRAKWKNQAVIERFVRVGLMGLWGARGESERPATKEARQAFFERELAKYRKGLINK